MKKLMIAALVAAQLMAAAAPAQAADLPLEEPATQRRGDDEPPRLREDLELSLRDGQATDAQVGSAPESPRVAAAQQDEPRKKGKSTGDKVLTGAAVILGVGAVAVGALLVALFVN